MFETVESPFTFNRCLTQGSIEALRLWHMMATQLLSIVEEKWDKKRMGILMDFKGEKARLICTFMLADNFWIMSHSKRSIEEKLGDLIEEAKK